ncbi:MAG: hypothetical protein AB7L76_05565 [Burkholderiaceae bacterium]
MIMMTALSDAITVTDYQKAIKESVGIDVKEACGFTFQGRRHRIWELKYQNKDRVYFITFVQSVPPLNLLIPLLFHHKKDQNTPASVENYCTDIAKRFLASDAKVHVLEALP